MEVSNAVTVSGKERAEVADAANARCTRETGHAAHAAMQSRNFRLSHEKPGTSNAATVSEIRHKICILVKKVRKALQKRHTVALKKALPVLFFYDIFWISCEVVETRLKL